MSVHPDPVKKLFGFKVSFANGEDQYGLVVAADKAAAQLRLENDTFACYATELIVDDQPAFVDMLIARYDSLVYFTSKANCN